jgi:hypothetical protein
MIDINKLSIGTEVILVDRADIYKSTRCIVKYIEPEHEVPGVKGWIYLNALDDDLNDKTDPILPFVYFAIVEDSNEYLFLPEDFD